MTTIVRAAFTHHAAHRLLRTHEAKRYRGTIDVAIPEADDRDIPLVVAITGRAPAGWVRHDGEQFYRPLLSPDGLSMRAGEFKRTLIDPLMMLETAPYWADYPFPRAPSDEPGRAWDNPLSHRTLDESFRLGSLVFSDADEVSARTEQVASSMRSIDGVIHVPCREPVWRVDIDTGEAEVVLSHDPTYLRPDRSVEYFRLDHADRISHLLDRLGVAIAWKTHPRDVLVEDPTALAFDPVPPAIAKLYGTIIPTIDRDHEGAARTAWTELDNEDAAVYDGAEGAGISGLQTFVDLIADGHELTSRAEPLTADHLRQLRFHAATLESYVIPTIEAEQQIAPAM